MFTKIKQDGRLRLIQTIKFNIGLPKKKAPAKSVAMRTMPNGTKRRFYQLTKDNF